MSNPVPVISLEYAHVGNPLRLAKPLRVLTLLTWLACLIAWLLIVVVDVESVLGSGPVIFLLGLSLLIVAYRARSSRHMVLAATHCAICLLFVALVVRLKWSPDEARIPFTIVGGIYTLAVGCGSLWVRRTSQ